MLRVCQPPCAVLYTINMSRLPARTQELLLTLRDETLGGDLISLFNEKPAGFAPMTTEVAERVQFAVLKLSQLGPKYFKSVLELYRTDTRDLFMAAGFGESLQAHDNWYREVTKAGNA